MMSKYRGAIIEQVFASSELVELQFSMLMISLNRRLNWFSFDLF